MKEKRREGPPNSLAAVERAKSSNDALPVAPSTSLPLTFSFFSSKKKPKTQNSKSDMATYNGVVSKMAEANYKPMCV